MRRKNVNKSKPLCMFQLERPSICLSKLGFCICIYTQNYYLPLTHTYIQ